MNFGRINYSDYILALILMGIDLLALMISFELALFTRINIIAEYLPTFETHNLSKYYWIIALTLFMFTIEKIYMVRYDFWSDLRRVYKGFFYAAFAVFTLLTLGKINLEYSRIFIIIFFLIALFVVPLFKRYAKYHLFKLKSFKKNIKIIADEQQNENIQLEIDKNWYLGLVNNQLNFDMVMISSKSFDTNTLQQIIHEHSFLTKDIFVIPYMDHLDFSHANIIDYSNIRLSAIHLENKLLNPKNIIIKYIFEKSIVILLFPFILILHFVLVALIKFDSQGSVIFKQKRLGKNSLTFSCYKYRTMHEDGQKLLDTYLGQHPEEITYYEKYHKYQNDPRITKIGKFLRKSSLDEFPQFYNILKGDMNLIGPRPYMIDEKKKIGKLYAEVILRVKPGITGLWQVSGRNELTFNQRIELDNWYIHNWSLWIDFMIFVKTMKVVLGKVGAK